MKKTKKNSRSRATKPQTTRPQIAPRLPDTDREEVRKDQVAANTAIFHQGMEEPGIFGEEHYAQLGRPTSKKETIATNLMLAGNVYGTLEAMARVLDTMDKSLEQVLPTGKTRTNALAETQKLRVIVTRLRKTMVSPLRRYATAQLKLFTRTPEPPTQYVQVTERLVTVR